MGNRFDAARRLAWPTSGCSGPTQGGNEWWAIGWPPGSSDGAVRLPRCARHRSCRVRLLYSRPALASPPAMATANAREIVATEPAVGPTRYRIPRWVAVIGWPVASGAAYAAFPVAISRHGPRLGWRDGQPGRANLLGLGPLGLGAALLASALVTHYTAAPTYGWVVRRRLAPEYLLTHGPTASHATRCTLASSRSGAGGRSCSGARQWPGHCSSWWQ